VPTNILGDGRQGAVFTAEGVPADVSRKGNQMDKLLKMIVAMHMRVMQFEDRERGATATEYALLVAFIAIAIVGAVTAFGTALGGFFTTLGTTVTGWAP
jgi:pilus assembly protein Flp/PilA